MAGMTRKSETKLRKKIISEIGGRKDEAPLMKKREIKPKSVRNPE